MGADRSYVETNRRALDRLKALVERASDEDLGQPMADGWTVASVLGHMAFWDLRIVTAVERWGPDGTGKRPDDSFPSGDDDAVDWMNDTVKPLISALQPRAAARVAVEAAEAADRGVAELSDDLLAHVEEAGLDLNPDRADHRGEHLDEIERQVPPA
jgi:uncharacterized damage-inducible protein DinB